MSRAEDSPAIIFYLPSNFSMATWLCESNSRRAFGACGFSAKSVEILVHPENASFVVLTSNPRS